MLWTCLSWLMAPGLTERNSASHGVWWVALALGAVLVVIVVLDLVAQLRETLANRHAGIGRPESGSTPFQVHAPDSELRDRHFSKPPRVGRDRKPNDPAPRDD